MSPWWKKGRVWFECFINDCTVCVYLYEFGLNWAFLGPDWSSTEDDLHFQSHISSELPSSQQDPPGELGIGQEQLSWREQRLKVPQSVCSELSPFPLARNTAGCPRSSSLHLAAEGWACLDGALGNTRGEPGNSEASSQLRIGRDNQGPDENELWCKLLVDTGAKQKREKEKMFLRQITFSISPGAGGNALSRHKGRRWQRKSFVSHTASTAVLGLRGNRPLMDYAGHWGSAKRTHGSQSAQVSKGQSSEPRAVLQKHVWTQLEPPLLATVPEHCEDQPCLEPREQSQSSREEGWTQESLRIFPSFF